MRYGKTNRNLRHQLGLKLELKSVEIPPFLVNPCAAHATGAIFSYSLSLVPNLGKW